VGEEDPWTIETDAVVCAYTRFWWSILGNFTSTPEIAIANTIINNVELEDIQGCIKLLFDSIYMPPSNTLIA
jgi:hypothetical protein